MSTDDQLKKDKTSLVTLRVPSPVLEDHGWPSPEDKLGRQKEIENLTPVLLNVEAPLVLAIDAPWGAGKTTFIKLWQKYLETEGMISLYINCWENDFVEDPLLPMLSAMDGWLSQINDDTVAKKAWESAKQKAPGLLKRLAVMGVKAGTLGSVDLDKDIESILAEAAGGVAGDIVDSFNAKKKVIDEFKELIAQAMDALPQDQQNLIIFIDELDRCRPTYAIEVLERMKHLFDIERVVFVIGINRKQLSKSLQGVYGPSFDGEHYLKRFIDLDYHLTIPDLGGYVKIRLNQNDITQYFSTRQNGKSDLRSIAELIMGFSQRFGYQLRDIDQLIMRIRLILRSVPNNHYLDAAVLCPLLVLREQDLELYKRFKHDATCVNEVIKFLLGDVLDINAPNYFGVVAGWLILSARDYFQPDLLNSTMEYWKDLMKNVDAQSESHRQIHQIFLVSQNNSPMRDPENLRLLTFNRIELVDQITLS